MYLPLSKIKVVSRKAAKHAKIFLAAYSKTLAFFATLREFSNRPRLTFPYEQSAEECDLLPDPVDRGRSSILLAAISEPGTHTNRRRNDGNHLSCYLL